MSMRTESCERGPLFGLEARSVICRWDQTESEVIVFRAILRRLRRERGGSKKALGGLSDLSARLSSSKSPAALKTHNVASESAKFHWRLRRRHCRDRALFSVRPTESDGIGVFPGVYDVSPNPAKRSWIVGHNCSGEISELVT